MRTVVLLRYPKAERADWKRRLISGLVDQKHDVSLVFGESSYVRHARAAVKEFGTDVWKKNKEVKAAQGPRLSEHFREKGLKVYRVQDLNGPATLHVLQRLQPELLVLLGTGIIRRHILEVPSKGTVHCHHGYLPDYRGVNTIEWSIYDGHDVYITTHFVDPGIDTGRILGRRRIPLKPGDTIDDVRQRCREATVALMLQTVRWIDTGTVTAEPQEATAGRQYFSMHPFFLDLVNERLRTQAGSVAP